MTRRWFTEEEIERAKRLREMGYSYGDIALRMKTGKSRIAKLAARGWKRHSFADRERPADLAIVAATMTVVELRQHYQVGGKLLKQWLDEIGFVGPDRRYHAPKREAPADLAEMHAKLTRRQLLEHYRCTSYVLSRWLVEKRLPTPRIDYLNRRKADAARKSWVDRYAAEHFGASA